MKVTLLAHNSPLLAEDQHNSATFLIEGISRACSHQMVRSRRFSFSQQSQRYIDFDKADWDMVIPPAILALPESHAVMSQFLQQSVETYHMLRKQGVRKEDARFVLPEACETSMVVTASFPDWQHFINLRCDKASQWEIRICAGEILKQLWEIAPESFAELHARFMPA